MSGYLECITNTMPDIHACTDHDVHTIACDGWAYRLITTGHDKTTGAPITGHVATGKACKGCVPREARVGMLCMACWSRLEQALSAWPSFSEIINTIDRAVQADNAGVRSSADGYVPIPGTRLAVEECRSYLSNQAWNDATSWVSTEDGARDSILFTRAAEIAFRSYPIEEKARNLRRVRCPDCGQLSFVRTPPTWESLQVVVKCQNAACGKTITDEDKLAEVARIERIA